MIDKVRNLNRVTKAHLAGEIIDIHMKLENSEITLTGLVEDVYPSEFNARIRLKNFTGLPKGFQDPQTWFLGLEDVYKINEVVAV